MANEIKKLKHCSLLESQKDFDIETTDGDVVHIEKGEKSIVGFDNALHYLKRSLAEQLDERDAKIDGISTRGLVEYLFRYMDSCLNLEEILAEKQITANDFCDYMVAALMYIGLEDDYFDYHVVTEMDTAEEVKKEKENG